MSEAIAGEPWDPDRIGMNVLRPWQSWAEGGPSVQHSEWWLRAHWGRAFEFEQVHDGEGVGHGLLVLRKREVEIDEAALLAPEPGEPREVLALRHNVAQLSAETIALARDRDAVRSALDAAGDGARPDRQLRAPAASAATRVREAWGRLRQDR